MSMSEDEFNSLSYEQLLEYQALMSQLRQKREELVAKRDEPKKPFIYWGPKIVEPKQDRQHARDNLKALGVTGGVLLVFLGLAALISVIPTVAFMPLVYIGGFFLAGCAFFFGLYLVLFILRGPIKKFDQSTRRLGL